MFTNISDLKKRLKAKLNLKNQKPRKGSEAEAPLLSLATTKHPLRNISSVIEERDKEKKQQIKGLTRLLMFFKKKVITPDVNLKKQLIVQTKAVIKKPGKFDGIKEKFRSTLDKIKGSKSVSIPKQNKVIYPKDGNKVAVINKNFWDLIKPGNLKENFKVAVIDKKQRFSEFRVNDHKLQVFKDIIITENKFANIKRIFICCCWVVSLIGIVIGLIVYFV